MVGLKDKEIAPREWYYAVKRAFDREGIAGFNGRYAGPVTFEGQDMFVKINFCKADWRTEERALELLIDDSYSPKLRKSFVVKANGENPLGVLLTDLIPGEELTYCQLDEGLVDKFGGVVDFVDCCRERGFYYTDVFPRNLLYDGEVIRFVDFDTVIFSEKVTSEDRHSSFRNRCYKRVLRCFQSMARKHYIMMTPEFDATEPSMTMEYVGEWAYLVACFSNFIDSRRRVKDREETLEILGVWQAKVKRLLGEEPEKNGSDERVL